MAPRKPEIAPKKPTPMENPPTASSDDDEDETEVEDTSSDDDDEDTPDPTTHLSSPPPKQPSAAATAAAAATPHSKSSDSEEDSGSGTDSEPEPEQNRKPIATKSTSKRPNEADLTQKDAKRANKKGVDGGGGGDGEEEEEETKKPLEEAKKQLFQRLWSEDDEIAVLKGILEFSKKKGVDPNQDMNAFHDFIKKSLHVDVSRNQLVDKIRRLKKKYVNNLERGLKKGEDMTFSKAHEQKAYDLSKRVWSRGAAESAVKSNGKASKAKKTMEVDNDKECSLKAPVVDINKFLFAESMEDYVITNGLDMIGGSKKVELEKRWKKLHIAQLELYIERSDLVKEQAVLMLRSLKSSSSDK